MVEMSAIDYRGYFIEVVLMNTNNARRQITKRFIESVPPEGIINPKWNEETNQWIEG